MASKKSATVVFPSKTVYRPDSLNIHKVPVKMWRKWAPAARRAFNNVMEDMRIQSTCVHPGMKFMVLEHWQTIRWNAACHAAFQVDATVS